MAHSGSCFESKRWAGAVSSREMRQESTVIISVRSGGQVENGSGSGGNL